MMKLKVGVVSAKKRKPKGLGVVAWSCLQFGLLDDAVSLSPIKT